MFTNWQFPNDETLKHEFQHEFMDKLHWQDYGPEMSFAEFKFKCQHSSWEEITPERDAKMSNRTHTRSKESLINVIKNYRSYPKFRNEETVQNLYDRFSENMEMDMPIIMQYRGGSEAVMAGNTRMDVAFQLGINPKVIVFRM